MPQKPQVRAKEKRRQTKRLARWREENAKKNAGAPSAESAASAPKK